MAKKKFPYWYALLIIILGGTASWAFYQIINNGVEDILLAFGITNIYLQSSIIIGVVFLLLLMAGFGFKKAINKIIR